MGSAMANGEGRALKAVTQALNSPLLNDNDIRGARYVLVSITCGVGKDELTMDELAEITDYVQEAAGQTAEMIKGYGTNDTLGDKVSVTIIASGFERKNTYTAPEVKMVHLEEKISEAVAGLVKEEKKVEISQMTEPMLKSEVVEMKNTYKETARAEVKNEVKEDELPPLELKKKAEDKIEPLHIEVKLPPVQEETYGVEIFKAVEEEKEEIKAEVLPEIMADEPVVEIKEEIKEEMEEELELPFAETPVITEVPAIIEAVEEIKAEEETPPVFEIVKEEEKSIEFDLTAMTQTEVRAEEIKTEPVAEVKIEQPVAEVKKEEPKVEVPVMNMEVKRTPISSVNIEKTVLPTSSANSGDSKVTKIADVTLNSQPPISDEEAKRRAQEKIQKLRELSFKVKTPGGLSELENEPAYKRKNVVLNDTPHSSDSEISRLTLGTDTNKDGTSKTPSLRPDNSFLHDKPD
jgi:cell division protein FtsZ